MKKMRLQDQGKINLLRISGKGHDDRSAQTMKSLRIKRPRAHGRKSPQSWPTGTLDIPGGGFDFFQNDQRIFLRKSGLLYAQGALLEGGIFRLCRNEAQSYTTAQLGRGEKKDMRSFLKKGPAAATGKLGGSEMSFL